MANVEQSSSPPPRRQPRPLGQPRQPRPPGPAWVSQTFGDAFRQQIEDADDARDGTPDDANNDANNDARNDDADGVEVDFDADFEAAFDGVVNGGANVDDVVVADIDIESIVDVADEIGADIDIDIAVVALDIDGLISARVTSREVIPLAAGASRVNDAVAGGASLGEITRLVESDPALAANIGRLARSAAFTSAVGERVSLPYSIMRLGVQGVRGVCLMSSLATEALRPGPLLALRRQVWRECLASALACQAIAVGVQGVNGDDAWLLGLVHDFGKVVALTAIEPDITADVPATALFWGDIMERHHCDAGWIVTDRWKLPRAIPFVTATHHQSISTGLHDVVACADRVVAAASSRGWQIAASDIAAIEGVRDDDAAMAIRIALAKHPYYLAAIA